MKHLHENMFNLTTHKFGLLFLSGITFFPIAQGFAQEETIKQTEEISEKLSEAEEMKQIVVTGDLWESLLTDIPASVTVFDTDSLQNVNIRHFGDLIERTPNLTFSGGTSRPRYFQLRGLGENSQFEGETPDFAVRFLVDDIDFTGIASVASAFDMQQVEVLRGPQAGAFGVNAAGGMIRMISMNPTPYWTGRTEVTAGQHQLFAGGFAFGGPVLQRNPEELMFRFSIYHNQNDGFRKNLTLHSDTNAVDEWTSRFRVTWNPTSDLRVETTIFSAYLDNGYDEFDLENRGFSTFSDQPGRDFQRSTGGSMRITYDGWDHLKLTSITSATHTDSIYSYDEDWTASSYGGFSELGRERSNFAQEFRLDSKVESGRILGVIDRWTLGSFIGITSEDTQYERGDIFTAREPNLITDFMSKNYALFGQASHDVTRKDRFILGLRVEHVDASADTLDPRIPRAFSPVFSDTMIGGKLTYEHDITDRILGFASVAQGYKAGGINVDARVIIPATVPLTVGTEDLWNYEMGIRGNWFDGILTTSLTGFHLQRNNTQVLFANGVGGNFNFTQTNGGDSRITGIEIESNLKVNTSLSFYNTLGVMSSTMDAFTLPTAATGGGRELAATPAYSWSFGSRYQHESGFFGTLDLTGRSDFFESNDHLEKRDAFFNVNASAGYTKDDWTISIWVRNLLDERYAQRVFFFGNRDPLYDPERFESLAQPQQIGITVRRDF